MDAGTRRRVSYTNIPPGRYSVEVVGSNNDGVWNEQGHRWAFTIAPFFYQTAWFYGLVGAGLVGAGLALHALRVRDLRLRNAVLAERAHLSQEIYDHISQIMTGVVLQLDAASQTLPEGPAVPRAYIDRASRLARQGIEETRLILRSLPDRPARSAAHEGAVDKALVESVAPLVEGTGVRLHAQHRGEPFAVPPEARHAIVHVGQEAVTNALRHGHPRTVEILVAFEPQGVRLTIEDDGCGFEPARVGQDVPPGLGLAGMAARVAYPPASGGGIEAIAAIRRLDPEARIIAITSYGGDVEIRRALDAGALGLLLKGASGEEVVEAVRRAYAGRPYIGVDVAEELRAGNEAPGLTQRESEVLALMADGLRNQEIAETLGLSLGTVKVHVNRILDKLDAVDRTEAVTRALRRGLITLR